MRPCTSALVALAIASLIGSTASAAPAEGRREGGCAGIEPGERAVRVRWGEAERTRGCFFFSGPLDLGRDDHLGASARLAWSGDRVTLDFGALRFAGSHRAESVRLTRRSAHEHGGAWTVTEHIEGRFERRDGCRVLWAQYRYTECRDGGACPGQCTITAPLVIEAAP